MPKDDTTKNKTNTETTERPELNEQQFQHVLQTMLERKGEPGFINKQQKSAGRRFFDYVTDRIVTISFVAMACALPAFLISRSPGIELTFAEVATLLLAIKTTLDYIKS
jgi:hypothetical protein